MKSSLCKVVKRCIIAALHLKITRCILCALRAISKWLSTAFTYSYFCSTTFHISPESLADLPTAVRVLASSTVEIAAASVGEKGIVGAVLQMEENRLALQALEVLAEHKEEVNAEADSEAAPDVEMPIGATADSGDPETPSAMEVRPEEAVGEEDSTAPVVVEEVAV